MCKATESANIDKVLTICQALFQTLHTNQLIYMHRNPVKQVLSLSPFYRWRKRGRARLGTLPEVTWSVKLGFEPRHVGSRIQAQSHSFSWLQGRVEG